MTDPFVLAGEAACRLEELGGFTAVARKSDGRVTLECYPREGGGRGVCLVIEGRVDSADALVQSALRALS